VEGARRKKPCGVARKEKLSEKEMTLEILSNIQSLPVGLDDRGIVVVVRPDMVPDPRTIPPCPVHYWPCTNSTEHTVPMMSVVTAVPDTASPEMVSNDWPGLTSKTRS
jgi:hypothetical protein